MNYLKRPTRLSQPPVAPIILTGYKLGVNILERYNDPLPPIYRLILALQRVLRIPIMFVEVEDEEDDEDPTLYVCCWVDGLERVSYEGTRVPLAFERVREVLDVEGEPRKRMFCPRARLYAIRETAER
jgi:hypothetical protein